MPLSRKKSCAPCRESKARCDRTIPECSRCTMRHLTCVYDGKEAYRPVASPHLGRPQVTKLVPSATEQDTLFDQEVVTTGSWEALMEGAGPVSSEDFDLARPGATSGVQLRLWPEKDDMHSLPETGGFTTINDPWALLQEPEDTSSTTVMQRNLPPVPGDDGDGLPHQALLRRNMFRACTMCTIILGQLTSFPKLLIEGDRLPPFIHAPCHIEDGLAVECGERGSHQCLPRELAICAGLVEMFYARTRANTDFVWTAIYDERARLQRAYPMLAPTEQLAALQSVTVLLLLQASDPTTVETNDSGLLLNTVLSFATSITRTYEWISEVRDAATNRRDWVFVESIRRAIALLYIVDALLDGFVYSPNTMCGAGGDISAGFHAVPLPAGRDLWEARTSRAWVRLYRQHLASRPSSKALTVGDALNSGGVVATSGSRANPAGAALLPDVMKWAEGLDSLGMLVWMVLPFEEARAREQVS